MSVFDYFFDSKVITIRNPKNFPSYISDHFPVSKIKEVILYKPNVSTVKFKNGKVVYVYDYGKFGRRHRNIKTEIRVEGDIIKGLKILDENNERQKFSSKESYEYYRHLKYLKKMLRGENVKEFLKMGSKSQTVKDLQIFLNLYKASTFFAFKPLKTDGIFGSKTRDAVKWFQFFTCCKIDGKVGIETWTTIKKLK